VAEELHLPVGLLNPHRKYAFELAKVASFKRQIRQGVLSAAQFPPTLTDKHGTITKPPSW
jgi:hypothetical protein